MHEDVEVIPGWYIRNYRTRGAKRSIQEVQIELRGKSEVYVFPDGVRSCWLGIPVYKTYLQAVQAAKADLIIEADEAEERAERYRLQYSDAEDALREFCVETWVGTDEEE